MALAVAELQKRQKQELADSAVAQSAHATVAEIAAAETTAVPIETKPTPGPRPTAQAIPGEGHSVDTPRALSPLTIVRAEPATGGSGNLPALRWPQDLVPKRGGPLVIPREKLKTGEAPNQPLIIEGRCRVITEKTAPKASRPSGATRETGQQTTRAQLARAAHQASSRATTNAESGIQASVYQSNRTIAAHLKQLPREFNQGQEPKAQTINKAQTESPHPSVVGNLLTKFFDTPGAITVIPDGAVSITDGPGVDFWESMGWPIFAPFRLARWVFQRSVAPGQPKSSVPPLAPDWQPITTSIQNRETIADWQFVWVETPYQADDRPQNIAAESRVRKSVATTSPPKTPQAESALAKSEPLRPKVERIPSEDEARPSSYYQIIPVRRNPALGPIPVAGLLAPGTPLFQGAIIDFAALRRFPPAKAVGPDQKFAEFSASRYPAKRQSQVEF